MQIDTGVGQPSTSVVGGTFTAPYTAITSGRKVVGTAGTAVALAASTTIKAVIITALQSNTDIVAVGGSTVLAAAATMNGTPLFLGQSMVVYIDDLSKVFVDSRVNDEGVAFNYFT